MSTAPLPLSNREADSRDISQLSTTVQVDRIRPYGKVRPVTAGEVLFEAGRNGLPVYILLSGSLDIVLPCPSEDKMLVTHQRGRLLRRVLHDHGTACHGSRSGS